MVVMMFSVPTIHAPTVCKNDQGNEDFFEGQKGAKSERAEKP